MKKIYETFRTTRAALVALLMGLMMLATQAGYGQTTTATVTTDKADYMPGEYVTITGTGWLPGETVKMVLDHTLFVHPDEYLEAIADAQGNIYN